MQINEVAMNEWKSIETAPNDRTIILFAETDIDSIGIAHNWKMATGCKLSGGDGWQWDGRYLKAYDVQPTHWMPLPNPPQ
jgi:hypothetical protein